MRSNRLQLNAAKTKVLWSTISRRLHQSPQSLLRDGADLVAPTAVVWNLGIFTDADVSMKSHVARTVSSFFAILRQLQCIRRSVSRTVLQSLMSSLVLSQLDYGKATLSGIPGHLVQQLQSVMNVAARMICSKSRYSHITSILRQLHWLKARERIDFKLVVLVYKCLHGTCPAYLADELRHSSEFVSRRRLRSASSLNLIVRRTRLSTYGDCSFSVSGPRVWNSLPPHVTSPSPVNICTTRLKSFLFSRSFP